MAKSKAQKNAPETFQALRKAHPDAHCELDHEGPFQLIVATILSAQTTDVNVNRVTPELFRRWPTAETLARAPLERVQETISRIGMFRQKAKNITKMAELLVERHGGKVPGRLEDLVELPGVGRKTANVVLGVAFGHAEGVVVDTHVQRISQRLGWTKNAKPEAIEQDLMKLFPQKDWDILSHTLIFHGRRICAAQRPACAACPVLELCPSAFKAEGVGRKPPRQRHGKTAKPVRKKPTKSAKKGKKAKARPERQTAEKKSLSGSRKKLGKTGKAGKAKAGEKAPRRRA